MKNAKWIWFVLVLTAMALIACGGGGGSDGGGDSGGDAPVIDPNDIDDDSDGYTENEGDCNDAAAEINPGAEEICGDDVDQDCDGRQPNCLPVPANVQASDLSEGLIDIDISWDASSGATYYNVYRAAFEEDGEYILVEDNITDTAYTFVQTWDDVEAITGPTPGLAYNGTANDEDKKEFITKLNQYRDDAMPTLLDFKAPAYFKVEACDDTGCSFMSDADLGQANYIHTQEYSEVAMQFIPIWGYAALLSLADVPSQAQGMTWCGIDLCGSGGGIVMARAGFAGDGDFAVNVDVVYEDYTEAIEGVNGAYAVMNGSLAGQMDIIYAYQGHYWFTGEFDIVTSWAEVALDMYAEIAGRDGNGDPIHEGYADITYNGETYQFSLPIQAADNVSGNAGKPIEPIYPARTDTGRWRLSTGDAPVTFAGATPAASCQRNYTEYTVQACPESVAP